MSRPAPVGTINGYSSSWCVVDGRTTMFDGTILGLARVAWNHGVLVGGTVWADFGAGNRLYRLIAEPRNARTGGFGVFAQLADN